MEEFSIHYKRGLSLMLSLVVVISSLSTQVIYAGTESEEEVSVESLSDDSDEVPIQSINIDEIPVYLFRLNVPMIFLVLRYSLLQFLIFPH